MLQIDVYTSSSSFDTLDSFFFFRDLPILIELRRSGLHAQHKKEQRMRNQTSLVWYQRLVMYLAIHEAAAEGEVAEEEAEKERSCCCCCCCCCCRLILNPVGMVMGGE